MALADVTPVLLHAKSFTWVREEGSNKGQPIRHWLTACGLYEGLPWCAAWATAMIHDMVPDTTVPRTASCDVLLEWGRKYFLLKTAPERGDLFLVMRNPRDAIHVGFVVDVEGDEFLTVEGNTNPAGGREGYGVFERRRKIDPRKYTFIRWFA